MIVKLVCCYVTSCEQDVFVGFAHYQVSKESDEHTTIGVGSEKVWGLRFARKKMFIPKK